MLTILARGSILARQIFTTRALTSASHNSMNAVMRVGVDPLNPEAEKLMRGLASIDSDQREELARLVRGGQSPKIVMVHCSDSRVNPAILSRLRVGEMFDIANIAGLVPPNGGPGKKDFHGTSAALQYAIEALKVTDLVVKVHGGCGGIASVRNDPDSCDESSYVSAWMDIVRAPIREALLSSPGLTEKERERLSEEVALRKSLENAFTFPFVVDAVNKGSLKVHGWHFDPATGILRAFNSNTQSFNIIASNMEKSSECCPHEKALEQDNKPQTTLSASQQLVAYAKRGIY